MPEDGLGALRALQDFFEQRGVEMRTLTLPDGTVTARTPLEEFLRALDVAEEYWVERPTQWPLRDQSEMADVIEDAYDWTIFFSRLTRD